MNLFFYKLCYNFTMGLVPAKHAVLRSFLNSEVPSSKVIEVRPDTFASREIHLREDGLVLYLPQKNNKNRNEKPTYEIVLHRPTTETLVQTYSLLRADKLEEAETKFVILHDKLPDFIEIAKEMCNVSGLQKIIDVLHEHPSWTLAHLAVFFAVYDSFDNPKVNSYLNSSDLEKGMSPLQVAITTQNLKTVQILVAANCSLEHLDFDGNSVFHYAATTTKDIIAALSQGNAPKCLNSRNKNGHTPLHMACLADKPECVKALLLAGADVNKTATGDGDCTEPGYVGNFLQDNPNTLYQNDMKHGGTPLHWANSRQVIEALIDVNCNINAENFQHRTALHVMVERNRLDCVVALLSRQAKADLPDKDGNRPIHLAVKFGFLPILQALIVFGADIDILNNAGQSPRHLVKKELAPKILYYLHAVGAKRCRADMQGCTDGCMHQGTYDGIPPPKVIGPPNRDTLNQMLAVAGMEVAAKKHKREFPKKGRLLCLDGGGIRGLVLVQMLLELEVIFQRPVNFCFDWIAGTSTGGILALGIASGKTMKECQCLYFRLKEKTFIGSRPYCSENLENVMKETFGSETVMSDIKHPKVMITSLLADRKPAELHLFRNYNSPSNILRVKHDSPYELPPPPEQQFVWQVARATGAAPTYYRIFQRYLDGGLIANNPTLDALTEIHEHCLALKAMGKENETCPASVVVSLGTGVIPVTELKAVDVFRPESIWDTTKLVMGIQNLGTLLVDQATLSDGRVVDRARAWCSSLGIPYFRFSPQMSEEIAMDEKSDEKLCNMLWETKAYMHENINLMRELADLLNR
ncbi:85/88 kDa calcium-independent phospholipase A2 isoform X2 [Anthonomus grandis grandis]|uniref:85/88 kDa calcium-independent phospholipase A2 isoform X2 n=1 Tax=Anthonomus grandis grandis TaxID=2921223 RepID=UPI002165E027|nr:85/88 kDa calcium-independent phospholipase A2 isoform X2 [Anthonomus grandis grandis]